jgi:hypothetical protein
MKVLCSIRKYKKKIQLGILKLVAKKQDQTNERSRYLASKGPLTSNHKTTYIKYLP